MSVTVETHSHACQWSSDGSTWTDFSAIVETIQTRHGYQADRGTATISCSEYPAGLDLGNEVIAYIDGVTVFRGYLARPALHGYGGSIDLECEGRGRVLAKTWGGETGDPEVDDLGNRVYESQTTAAIIVNMFEANGGETSMQSINDDGVTRGTINPITLRVGQAPWSLIRGDAGLDVIRNYWTAERNDGAVVRRLFEVAGSADLTITEAIDILPSPARTPQGNESIINKCIVYGFEYEGATIGGPGVGDYETDNAALGTGVRQGHIIRNQMIEDDAEALETATLYVTAHNFPADQTRVTIPGNASVTIGITVLLDAPDSLDHAGDSGARRFAAEVAHDYSAGGYTTSIVCIRTSSEV